MQPQKAARDCRGRQFAAESQAFEQVGEEFQRPLEHVRQGNDAPRSAGDFRDQPGELGIAQVGPDDGIRARRDDRP